MTGPDRHRDTEAPRARHGFRDAPGRPLRYALDDWRTLIRLRESYARDLLAGKKPHLVLPRVDGIPIAQRMTELADRDVVKKLTTLP